jgi:hypothetical protein
MGKGLGINSRPALTKWGWPARIGLSLAAILFGWSAIPPKAANFNPSAVIKALR